VGHIARCGVLRNGYRTSVGKLENFGRLDIGETMILKWVLQVWIELK